MFSFLTRKLAKRDDIAADHEQALRENVEYDRHMKGAISTPENAIARMYRGLQVDTQHRMTIIEIRHMDKVDPRVKKIHRKISRDVTKGGLRLCWQDKENKRVQKLWAEFERRTQLNRREKLKSDARGVAMEGSLVMQWVIGEDRRVIAGLRMPSETIVPNVDERGVLKDPRAAYKQIDILSQRELASFPLWQVAVSRLDPDNYDDLGCMGRPYLDATRSIWRKLVMTEEDLVIRRRHRAPQKLSHVLEGATDAELQTYEAKARARAGEITTDFFSNRKGSVTAVAGDANLDQIADVAHLLDSFFTGSPAPKGLFGYVGDLARDVLEDLKRDYYEEIDGLQDVVASVYEQGFRLDLLLQGLNPDAYGFRVEYAERMTETRNQRADYALKLQALQVPMDIVWSEAGLDPVQVRAKREEEQKENDLYRDDLDVDDQDEADDETNPAPGASRGKPAVSVTPGNGRKGESATDISTRSK